MRLRRRRTEEARDDGPSSVDTQDDAVGLVLDRGDDGPFIGELHVDACARLELGFDWEGQDLDVGLRRQPGTPRTVMVEENENEDIQTMMRKGDEESERAGDEI